MKIHTQVPGGCTQSHFNTDIRSRDENKKQSY